MLLPRFALAASLIIGVVVVPVLTDRATQRTVTGIVLAVDPRSSITVANDTTDPTGVHITLRDTTVYDSSLAALAPGAQVTVWFRDVGERQHVADLVQVRDHR